MKHPFSRARLAGVLLFVAVTALLGAGCGASGGSGVASTAKATTTADTTQSVTAGPPTVDKELDRLRQELPAATAVIPSRWTSPTVDRAYLTAIFDDAQNVWRREFQESHLPYKRARLVLFTSKVESGCGRSEDSGPFYCPADDTVYLDLRFFAELAHAAGKGGAAQAFIVGHEVGHHVQRLLGIADRVAKANQADPSLENARSVQVELQADCLAGVWGRSAFLRSKLSVADLNEALHAAKIIGDDYIAHAAGVVVDASQWTHGSSQQRQHWLRTGYESGRPSACDTFKGH